MENPGRGQGAWRRQGGGGEPRGRVGKENVEGEGSLEEKRRGGREPEPGGEGNHEGGGGKRRSAGVEEGRSGGAEAARRWGWRAVPVSASSLALLSNHPPSLAGGAGGWARSAFFPEPAARAVPRPGWRSGPLAPGSSTSRGHPIPGGSGQVRERGAGSGRTSRAKRL